MAPKSIFYAWQTDCDVNLNRNFIEDCLRRAIKKLNRENLSDLVIDRDTKNVPGMPDIGLTILEKITKSSVVVADLSIINPAVVRRVDERPVSNPNALFELGCAIGKLGTTAVVGIINSARGNVEDLPFDLRSKRLLIYKLEAGDDKTEVRTMLVGDLANAIRGCLGDTEEAQIQQNSSIHDALVEIQLFGTEIDEWYGIRNLPKVIQDHSVSVREVGVLVQKSGYSDGILGMVNWLTRNMESASTLQLTEENWPAIKSHVASAGHNAELILRLINYKYEQASHDQSVAWVVAMPALIDQWLANVESETLRVTDLDRLSHKLRRMAFNSLLPQHPKFGAGLSEISLDFRRHFLHLAKNEQTPNEAMDHFRDIRARLSQLIANYSPLP